MPLPLCNHCNNFGTARSSEAFLRQRSEAAGLGWSLPVALCDAYLSESMKTKPLDSVPLEYCWCYSGKPGIPTSFCWREKTASHTESLRSSFFCMLPSGSAVRFSCLAQFPVHPNKAAVSIVRGMVRAADECECNQLI
ncbi:uncharacterized protein LOC104914046 isoform X3 [Meleagris gallopavo]|uniref:uncharacterized protein LOC104914046 isoform X3 n=1 Tax=Meleagris gallopavo TaxID=9103 RepID=UPI00093DECCE|nr:uncharacterized protein LOC104914046 isoform X3 [Meleagris gallopavo]